MHMTNGASFNLTNKKYPQNFDIQSNGDKHSYQNNQ